MSMEKSFPKRPWRDAVLRDTVPRVPLTSTFKNTLDCVSASSCLLCSGTAVFSISITRLFWGILTRGTWSGSQEAHRKNSCSSDPSWTTVAGTLQSTLIYCGFRFLDNTMTEVTGFTTPGETVETVTQHLTAADWNRPQHTLFAELCGKCCFYSSSDPHLLQITDLGCSQGGGGLGVVLRIM